MLILKKYSNTFYKVEWDNGVHIGDFEKNVDGFFYWWPVKGKDGSWSSEFLRLIVEKLEELNKKWEEEINNYFKNEQNKQE